ncbi:MAG TPA: hypothetical protein VFZ48_04175 [Candidatus Saccharimonadales bacterium]
MNHADYLVDLVDNNGAVTGSKKRQRIVKSVDLYHTVFIILYTPDHHFILSKIPTRRDLPNLYSASVGATAATIRRHGESSDQASLRAVKNELLIDDARLKHIGDSYLELPDGHRTYASIYCGTHFLPEDFSHKDIESLEVFGPNDLDNAMRSNKGAFAPTFLAIWQKYREKLLAIWT